MLMREINFQAAQPVAEVIEDLAISYDINGGLPNTGPDCSELSQLRAESEPLAGIAFG